MKSLLNFRILDFRKILIPAILFSLGLSAVAQVASDNAGNYGSGWTNGSNGGSGFGPWTISTSNGGGNVTGFGGTFIGNSTAAGITGMANPAFGLYANPSGSGAYSSVKRALTAPLAVGQMFSFQWGINFDSGAGGDKGFNIYTGGISGTSIANVNNAGSDAITLNGTNIGFGYGVNSMTWTFNYISPTSVTVSANDRDGTGTYSTTLTVSGAPDAFEFYASNMQLGDQAQPYFNNLSVVPEPSTWALIGLGTAFVLWRVRRRVHGVG